MFFTQVCCVVLHTLGASPPACSGSPPVFLGRSLDLLWMLCGQLRLRSGLTPACSCFQSPQLPPEVHRLRLNRWNLIHCTSYYRSEFPSPLLTQPLVLQFGFGLTSACGCLWVLFPYRDTRGWKQWLIRTYLFTWKSGVFYQPSECYSTCRCIFDVIVRRRVISPLYFSSSGIDIYSLLCVK